MYSLSSCLPLAVDSRDSHRYNQATVTECNTSLLLNLDTELSQNSRSGEGGKQEWTFLHVDDYGNLRRKTPQPTEEETQEDTLSAPTPPQVTVLRRTTRTLTREGAFRVYIIMAPPTVSQCALRSLVASEISVNRQVAPRLAWTQFVYEKLQMVRRTHGVVHAWTYHTLYNDFLSVVLEPLTWGELFRLYM